VYKLDNILGSIYSVCFESREELWKTFVRYQEYYESPKFHNKLFTLNEFRAWYSKEFGNGEFTYGNDWAGFNIPSFVIEECQHASDLNIYDYIMFGIYADITKDEKKDFYLLGVCDESTDEDLPHEIAHGLFHTSEEYKNSVVDLVDQMPEREYEKIRNYLIKIGYGNNVLIDELQAYMSTGIAENMNFPRSLHEPFIKLYKETIERLK
jgi:hypothetical protein